jgi:hypothetical protein
MVRKIILLAVTSFLLLTMGCERGWIWLLFKYDVEISNPEYNDVTISVDIWEGKKSSGGKLKSYELESGRIVVWSDAENRDYFFRVSVGEKVIEEIVSVSSDCSIWLDYSHYSNSLSIDGDCESFF